MSRQGRNGPRQAAARAAHDESLCRRCGRCCHAKVIVDDEVYYTDIPCPYLDTASKLCTVYEKRFEKNGECLTVEEGIKMGVFPADCPYVAGAAGYRGPHAGGDAVQTPRIYRGQE